MIREASLVLRNSEFYVGRERYVGINPNWLVAVVPGEEGAKVDENCLPRAQFRRAHKKAPKSEAMHVANAPRLTAGIVPFVL